MVWVGWLSMCLPPEGWLRNELSAGRCPSAGVWLERGVNRTARIRSAHRDEVCFLAVASTTTSWCKGGASKPGLTDARLGPGLPIGADRGEINRLPNLTFLRGSAFTSMKSPSRFPSFQTAGSTGSSLRSIQARVCPAVDRPSVWTRSHANCPNSERSRSLGSMTVQSGSIGVEHAMMVGWFSWLGVGASVVGWGDLDWSVRVALDGRFICRPDHLLDRHDLPKLPLKARANERDVTQ